MRKPVAHPQHRSDQIKKWNATSWMISLRLNGTMLKLLQFLSSIAKQFHQKRHRYDYTKRKNETRKPKQNTRKCPINKEQPQQGMNAEHWMWKMWGKKKILFFSKKAIIERTNEKETKRTKKWKWKISAMKYEVQNMKEKYIAAKSYSTHATRMMVDDG